MLFQNQWLAPARRRHSTCIFTRRMSHLKLLVAASLVAGAAFAQEPAPLRLTLRDAVNLALKQNPQVILSSIGIAESQDQIAFARAALLPKVGAAMAETVNRTNLAAQLGRGFPGMAQHVGPFETFQIGASGSVPLFDLTLWRRYRGAQAGVEASKASASSVHEQAVLLVVSQYLGAQRAGADVAAAESRVSLAQALYDQAADLQANGVGTGIDTLRANVQLQNEKQRLIVARTQLETALLGLARLLSIDSRQRIELADQVSFFETPAAAADQSVEQALASRSEMRELAAQRQRAELARKGAKEARLPKVGFGASWGQLGLTPDSIIPAYQIQATLSVPLYTGGEIKTAQSEADLALRKLDQNEKALRDRIVFEVKTALAQLESARNEVTVAKLGVDLAGQEVEQARDRFQAGVANNIEVVNAQNEVSRASDNQIAALYRYNQARADLAHAAGQMEALYAK
jgi:outer membrane protein